MFHNSHRTAFDNFVLGLLSCMLGTILFRCGSVAAGDEIEPKVVFISLAEIEQHLAAERTFVTTLKLNLDNYVIKEATADSLGLKEMPLHLIVEHLHPLLQQKSTVGAMWLTWANRDVPTLYVATMEQDRVIIRLFRQHQSDDAARELAKTVAALIESTYLLELTQRDEPPAICPEPDNSDDAIPQAQPHRVISHWYVSAMGQGALVGNRGPSPRLSGSSGASFDFAPNWSFKLGGGGGYGPFGKERTYTIDGWELFGEARIELYVIDSGFRMGPSFGIMGGMQSIRVKEDGISRSYRYPKADAVLRLNLTIPVSQVTTMLGFGVVMSSYRTEISAAAEDRLIYRNSALGWLVSVDLVFF